MVIKEGYKQTEIGVIPKDWEVKTISEFTTPVRGGSPRPAGDPKYFNGNFIPWLTVASLTNIPISQIYVSETDNYLTEAGSFHSRILEKETLIIANSGATLGVAKLLSIKCCANDGIAALLDFDTNISKFYVVYFINTKIKYLREVVATGNGQPNLNTDLIGKIQIPLPPNLAEQTAIATALSDADGLITGLEKLFAKKRNIKHGAMQQLLQPKEGWEVKKLGEVAHVIMGQSPLSQFYNTESIGLPLIQGNADINNRKTIIRSYTSFVTKKGKAGDIIMSVRAPVGEISRATFDCCLGRGVCSISYENDFIYHYLIYFEKSWAKLSTGSTFDSVNSKQVKELEMPIPKSKEEQLRIAKILSDMDAELSALEQKLEKYKKVKLGMMQELLTGKTRLV